MSTPPDPKVSAPCQGDPEPEITGMAEIDGHIIFLHNNRSETGALAEAQNAEVVDLTEEELC